MPLEPGQTILHYRIDRKIGEGGMGVVYLAEDTRLGRRVALKVLPAEVSADAGRRARFEREARAIAALNHPNIVTLHSVEEAEGVCFLTMELVDGQRLTQSLAAGGMELSKLLDGSLGIADALVAAHRQGVVHRDLKPDNVMVTSDGRIKVLDFGLAKLREAPAGDGAAALPTASITSEGKILGTVAYMSPEQAEGRPLDHRSDIFSFGIVLYEMATGRRPFQGETAISTLSAILKDTPTPAQEVNPALPRHLGRIVRRCLAKDPERRYQSTDDLRNELRELKDEIASGELPLGREAAGSSSTAVAPRSLKRPAVLGLAAGLVLLILVVAAWLGLRGEARQEPAAATEAPIQMSRATTDGKVQEAAISPDGRYVAYVRGDGSAFSLRLRQLVTGDEVQVVAPSAAALTSPSFSGDGNFLFYVSLEPGRSSGWVHRVSVLGGAPRRIVDGAWSVTASPDGQRLALTGGTLGDVSYVRIVGSDGDAPKDLVSRKGRDHFDSAAKWSTDGRTLAIVSHRYGDPQQIVLLDPETGEERPLPASTLRTVSDLSWMPGRDALVVAGSERPVNQRGDTQIWEISTAGEQRALTHDLNSYSGLTVTADGSTVAAVQEERRSGIDVAPVRDGVPGAFAELFPTSAARAGFTGIAWLPGGRLAHSMMQADVQQVFVTDVVAKSPRALSAGPSHHTPVVSRDGRMLIVLRDDGDRTNLWRLDPETGSEQRLTDEQFDAMPILAPDGSWAVYVSMAETLRLLKVPTTGGTPVELARLSSWCVDVSADGQDALCFVPGPTGDPQVMIVPLGGGEPRPVAGLPLAAHMIRYGPDGRSITYLIAHEGAAELWSLPAPGDPPRQLMRLAGTELSDFVWSPDGNLLATVKVSRSGDVVLLKRAPAQS